MKSFCDWYQEVTADQGNDGDPREYELLGMLASLGNYSDFN